jgi:hypothetical protein
MIRNAGDRTSKAVPDLHTHKQMDLQVRAELDHR